MRLLRRFQNLDVARLCSRQEFRRGYHSSRDVIAELDARGMFSQSTNYAAITKRLEKTTSIYMGIDPTASSLHVGHLFPLMSLMHLYLRGHNVIPVIGGATGLVGDPSGKSEERIPLENQTVVDNSSNLTVAIERLFNSASSYASERLGLSESNLRRPTVRNNVEWLGSLNLLEFLSKAGRHARIPTMLGRDSVKIRMQSQQGLSFTEFSYQLLQAYDFYHLYHECGCTMQIGGSDQWGNILAGVDLIDRTRPSDGPIAHGITTPLLTTASGQKFGKSEGNAVWLDRKLTSVLDFYQFFFRTQDADVEKYLKMFTLLPLEMIAGIIHEHRQAPEKRKAQRILANEVVELVHGKDAVNQALVATRVLFDKDIQDLRAKDIVFALSGDPRLTFCSREQAMDQPIWRLAADHGLVKSASEAKRLAKANGLYLNNFVVDLQRTLRPSDLIDGGVIILRAGKDNHLALAIH